ncbi:cuticle protein 21-like [Plodia interpunctella]|uniref:cuticle protein 21-like n=1 Tax=Plodia interpunctella TaxID=58824 RepID=UPI0023681FB9|nr:cuticle protein 21-like [Plodia interpunctella]
MNSLLMIACLLTIAAQAVTSSPVDTSRYAFNYAVNDPHTRDKKAQWEVRNGDAVKGSYSLLEPDGGVRVVDYTADGLSGFNAIVKKTGPNLHPLPILPKIPLLHKVPLIDVPHVVPLIAPLNYGFGGAPLLPHSTSTILGPYSLPWDPITHSFGGWAPITGHATVFSKKWVKGKLYKWVTGPIPLTPGTKLVFRKKH